jgi:ADP-ribose pyrophosphatase
LRISIDEAPWLLDCAGYEPPYHVDPSVLENDRTEISGGWADPEDTGLIRDDLAAVDTRFRDDDGRPLNPHGRTGIAGRGLLGYWGRNLSAAATVTRANQETGRTEILLGTSEDRADPGLPKGFVLREEDPEAAVKRVLETEVGWQAGETEAEVVFEGFTYDRRQTDHAWVETRAFLLHGGVEDQPATFAPGGAFDEIRWWPLDADTVNRLPSDQAQFVRESVTRLVETGRLDQSQGEHLLERTG